MSMENKYFQTSQIIFNRALKTFFLLMDLTHLHGRNYKKPFLIINLTGEDDTKIAALVAASEQRKTMVSYLEK